MLPQHSLEGGSQAKSVNQTKRYHLAMALDHNGIKAFVAFCSFFPGRHTPCLSPLDFSKLIFQKSSTDQQGVGIPGKKATKCNKGFDPIVI